MERNVEVLQEEEREIEITRQITREIQDANAELCGRIGVWRGLYKIHLKVDRNICRYRVLPTKPNYLMFCPDALQRCPTPLMLLYFADLMSCPLSLIFMYVHD